MLFRSGNPEVLRLERPAQPAVLGRWRHRRWRRRRPGVEQITKEDVLFADDVCGHPLMEPSEVGRCGRRVDQARRERDEASDESAVTSQRRERNRRGRVLGLRSWTGSRSAGRAAVGADGVVERVVLFGGRIVAVLGRPKDKQDHAPRVVQLFGRQGKKIWDTQVKGEEG